MNRKEQVIEILKELFKKKANHYHKHEIETAIITCRGLDPRTLKNWWAYLWRLGFFEQPSKDKFILNYNRLAELEMPTPLECDPKQARFILVKKDGV
jgi:hypothetical protein